MKILDTFGMRLRVTEYRQAAKMSQMELAHEAELGQSQISRMENMARGIRLDHLEAVARVFGVPVTELIVEDNDDDEFVTFYKVFGNMPPELKQNLVNLANSMLRA